MQEVSVNQLLEAAVDKLPPLRKRVTKLRMRNPRYREQVANEVAMHLAESDRVASLGVKIPINDAQFGMDSKIGIDPGKLEELLKIIVTYLPQILDIIMRLFAPAIAFLVVSLAASLAMAQCPGGRCPSGRAFRVFRPAARAYAPAPVPTMQTVAASVQYVPQVQYTAPPVPMPAPVPQASVTYYQNTPSQVQPAKAAAPCNCNCNCPNCTCPKIAPETAMANPCPMIAPTSSTGSVAVVTYQTNTTSYGSYGSSGASARVYSGGSSGSYGSYGGLVYHTSMVPRTPYRSLSHGGPRWQYYGSNLAAHLAYEHGIDPTGMSYAEMEAAHSRAHNASQGMMNVASYGRQRGPIRRLFRWF